MPHTLTFLPLCPQDAWESAIGTIVSFHSKRALSSQGLHGDAVRSAQLACKERIGSISEVTW